MINDQPDPEFDHYHDFFYRRQLEQSAQNHRLMQHVKNLFRMGVDDLTVKTFLDGWMTGHFESFEQMVCQMAIQLSIQKMEYMRAATKMLELAPIPSPIVQSSNVKEEGDEDVV